MKNESLNERFSEFVKRFPSCELIDALLTTDSEGKKRADYLLFGRQFILEQKCLEVDPADKPQKFADHLMGEGRFIAYGRVSLNHIFDRLPDGKRLYRNLVHKMTSTIEDQVSKADKQLRDTREIFGIPDAVGVLVLLNQSAANIDPQLIRYRLFDLFKRRNDGSVRFIHTDIVIVIYDLHTVDVGGQKFPRIESYTNSVSRNRDSAERFARELKQRWIAFSGRPYVGVVGKRPIVNFYEH